MNLSELRSFTYELVSGFFQKATVVWAEQQMVKPTLPYITLKFGDVQRTTFPVVDGDLNRSYPCSVTLEINLYTMGRKIGGGKGTAGSYENTAVSDLSDFFRYMDSDEIIDRISGAELDFELMPPIRDLSELMNDKNYRYRAMAEVTVSYSEQANGAYGIGGITSAYPNQSGGGTAEMAETDINTIEKVDLQEE